MATAAAVPTPTPPPAAGGDAAARAVSAEALAALQRPSPWFRARAWLKVAYTDVSSVEHRVLLEWIIFFVILSVVATVLEHDAALEEQLRWQFIVVEGLVLVFFVADYVLNIIYAPSRKAYLLSFWGIVDLLAILPGLLLLSHLEQIKMFKGLRGLRFLRFLRFLRVAKIAKEAHRRAQLLEAEEDQVSFLDLQMLVIVSAALLLFVPDDSLRNLLLGFILIAALTVGIRRWLVAHQHATVSVIVLLVMVVSAINYALALDNDGHFARAVGILIATVGVTVVSWTQIEGPAGGL